MTQQSPIRVLLADDHSVVREGIGLILSVEEDIEVVGQVADGAAAAAFVASHPVDVALMDIQMPGMDGIEATRRIVSSGSAAGVVILTTFERDDYLFDAINAGASGFLLKNASPEHLVEAVRAVHAGQALLSPEVTLRVLRRAVGAGGTAPGPAQSRPQQGGPQQDRPQRDGTQNTLPDAAASGTSAAAPSGVPGSATPGPATPAATGAAPHHAVELTPREADVLALLAAGYSNQEIAAELFVSEATVKTHVSNLLGKLRARDRVQAIVTAYRLGLASPHAG